MPTPDPHNLQRFLDAQASTYTQARSELAAGEKRSHWMWFIFPQIQGLGSSSMAQRFAIHDLAETRAFLAHPILGSRLIDCATLVAGHANRSVDDIFGYPDNLKFHSSMTLFAQAAEPSLPEAAIFTEALRIHFHGQPDKDTLRQLPSSR